MPSLLQRLHDFWVRTELREQVTQDLRSRIAALDGVVLDIGGGREAPHDQAWSANPWRIRVDISMTHHPDVVADASALPVKDGSIDAIVMSQLLEHVAEPALVIADAFRVLRPGGTLHGSVPFLFPVHGDPHDYFRYTAEGLRYLLRRFHVINVNPLGNHFGAAWWIVASRSRLLRMFNPLMRRFSRRPSSISPQGYAFTAIK
jgi:SAM-dependent methyltransferase